MTELRERDKILKLVFKLLYLNGIITFDASKVVLDPELESRIKGEG